MELNEVHTEHEHASTSLKVVLLIFVITLVAALGYLVWAFMSDPDTTDYSAANVKKQAGQSEAKAVACGDEDKYGFELTFGAMWTGYKIKEVTPTYALVTCYFTMPTTSTDTVWTTAAIDHAASYASVFAVSVYTPAQWTASQEEANKPTELGHNTSYYWGWAPAQALPDDLQTKKIADDVAVVVATFKIAP